MVPLEGQKETAEGEEEGGVEQQQEKEEVSKEQNGSPDGGKENQEVQKENALLLHFQTYKEGVQKYGLHYADSNVVRSSPAVGPPEKPSMESGERLKTKPFSKAIPEPISEKLSLCSDVC